jgi:hypothetical protein
MHQSTLLLASLALFLSTTTSATPIHRRDNSYKLPHLGQLGKADEKGLKDLPKGTKDIGYGLTSLGEWGIDALQNVAGILGDLGDAIGSLSDLGEL